MTSKKIQEGLEDIRAGRSMPLSKYKAKRGGKTVPSRELLSLSCASSVGLTLREPINLPCVLAESAHAMHSSSKGRRRAEENQRSRGGSIAGQSVHVLRQDLR
jgi:hypothetical protein